MNKTLTSPLHPPPTTLSLCLYLARVSCSLGESEPAASLLLAAAAPESPRDSGGGNRGRACRRGLVLCCVVCAKTALSFVLTPASGPAYQLWRDPCLVELSCVRRQPFHFKLAARSDGRAAGGGGCAAGKLLVVVVLLLVVVVVGRKLLRRVGDCPILPGILSFFLLLPSAPGGGGGGGCWHLASVATRGGREMITFVDSAAVERGDDRCLDPQLWHACAGGMVQMPPVASKVYYFPQGHAEHAQGQAAGPGSVDLPPGARLPAHVLCRVAAVRFMADPDTDEVFAKIRLVPVPARSHDADDDTITASAAHQQEDSKPASFAKTLTQSDANNGGGFSVPRYCAETIFPRLDYSADPPVQTVLAKDVHGVVWKFRHIYRGTPRRHLLTTGWSSFVNQKKLVAGDSIVFMRTENGDLCVGIRRAKKGGIGGPEQLLPPPPLPPAAAGGNYGGFSMFLRGEEDGKGARGNNNKVRARVRPEEVAEAANLAVSGQPFEVLYYPRASTPEFCVKAAAVRAAMRTQWCPGMRFKMAFETEDSSRISWFMGTVSAVQVADPIRWPNSPWRLLQVTWDEPDLLQNVKRVSPWLVELVSNMPAMHLAPFSPPRKKLCVPFYPDHLPHDGQFPAPMFHGNPLGRGGVGPMCYFPDGTPAGIQGARHAQFGISLSDLHLNKLQSSLSPHGLHQIDHGAQPRIAAGLIIGHPAARDDISCLLTIGNHQNNKKSDVKKAAPTQLMLFGKPILTEQQITLGNSGGFSPMAARKSPSDGSADKSANNSDIPSPQSDQNGHTENLSCGGVPLCQDNKVLDLGLETGHCKIFMQSEDVGRTLDLSAVGSYEELYRRLSDMFGIEKAELMSHLFYRDAAGALKHTGDESFSDFTKTARRLTILTEASGGDSLAS